MFLFIKIVLCYTRGINPNFTKNASCDISMTACHWYSCSCLWRMVNQPAVQAIMLYLLFETLPSVLLIISGDTTRTQYLYNSIDHQRIQLLKFENRGLSKEIQSNYRRLLRDTNAYGCLSVPRVWQYSMTLGLYYQEINTITRWTAKA